MMRERRAVKVELCACCGVPSEVDCWNFRLCFGCWKEWHANVEVPPESARWDPDNNASQAAWRKVSNDWLAKSRKARAA